MAKIRVAILGTVNKSVLIDTDLGTRVAALEGAVAALGAAGTVKQHRALGGLTQGDDHPQYTMWQAPETINAPWNFAAEPSVEGVLLTEFVQDVVGMELVENTNSITWTYDDTAGELEANVVPEFVEDTVGAMLTDTSSVDLVYTDASGQITANVICANPSGLIGMAAVNGVAATPLRSDGRHAIDSAIAPTWTGKHSFTTGGVDVASTSTPGLSMDGQKWQCFAVLFVNTAGVIQHQIVGNGLSAQPTAYADRIIGASGTLANTPTNLDSTHGFVSGVGLLNGANYAVVFNTAAQTINLDNVNALCSYYDGGVTRFRVLSGLISRNVNGSTVNRLELRVLDEITGAAAPINTTLLPAGKFMVIQVMGFLG